MRGRRRGAVPALAALILVLGACGGEGADDPSEVAGPPDPSRSTTSTPTGGTAPTPRADPTPQERLLDVVALSAAGGATDPALTPVASEAEAAAYAAEFEPAGRGPLRAAIDDAAVPPGLEPRAAVVAVGCDEPAEVLLDGGGDQPWTARAVPSKATVQCLVPVTFVALVAVPG